jgi:hypothetical protein
MTAAAGHAVPDAERAETYLRLQAEAELRTALGFPRVKKPRQLPLPARLRDLAFTLRHRPYRGRRARLRAARGQSAESRIGKALASPPGVLAVRAARWAGQPLAALPQRTSYRLRRARRRLPWHRRQHQPVPAQACLDRVMMLAGALAGAGAIGKLTAESVLADMRASLAARSLIDQGALLGDRFFPGRLMAAAPGSPAGPLRVVPVGMITGCAVDGQPIGLYLGAMIISPDEAALTMAATFPPDLARNSQTGMPAPMDVLQQCTASDDRGGTYHAHFSGGGGDRRWDGRLSFRPVPPAGVHWLDVTVAGADPVRVSLDTAPATLPTTVVRLSPDGAADRYIDRLTLDILLAGSPGEPGGDPDIAMAVSGLLAAGVAQASSPALGRFAAVARRLGLDLPGPLAGIRPGTVPADWLGMMARRDSADGPAGVTPLAAALPDLDGISCVIADLQSEPECATLQVHARGWPEPRHSRTFAAEPLRWTARDDVGGCYVAYEGGGSFGGGRADLELRLQPAISPRARALEIVVTGRTSEVSVTVPLQWRQGI